MQITVCKCDFDAGIKNTEISMQNLLHAAWKQVVKYCDLDLFQRVLQ